MEIIDVMAPIPDIGTRIRKRRQEIHLSQKQLAHLVGVNESAVVAWETGRHYPSRKLGALEAVLGDLTGTLEEFVFRTPDEAAIWSMDRFSEGERRALIRALRETRAQPLCVLRNCALTLCNPPR